MKFCLEHGLPPSHKFRSGVVLGTSLLDEKLNQGPVCNKHSSLVKTMATREFFLQHFVEKFTQRGKKMHKKCRLEKKGV